MNSSVLWGAAAGFLIGSFCYIFINFFWTPVSGYKKIRKRIDEDLKTLLVSGRKDKLNRRDLQILASFYTHAKALDLYCEKKLPRWYRLSLDKKGEKPKESIPELLSLAAIKNPAHLEKRILQIRRLLFPEQKE